MFSAVGEWRRYEGKFVVFFKFLTTSNHKGNTLRMPAAPLPPPLLVVTATLAGCLPPPAPTSVPLSYVITCGVSQLNRPARVGLTFGSHHRVPAPANTRIPAEMRAASLYLRELWGIQRGLEKTDESSLHSSGLPVCLLLPVCVCVCVNVHPAWTLSLSLSLPIFPSYPVGNVMPHESPPGLNRPR